MMDTYNLTSKLGFSAEYVDAMAPVERGVYIGYHIREQEEEKKEEKGNGGPTIGKPIGE